MAKTTGVKRKADLVTTGDYIDKCAASNAEFAALIGESPSTVYNWRVKGLFPPRKYKLLETVFKARRLKMPDNLFNWDKPK